MILVFTFLSLCAQVADARMLSEQTFTSILSTAHRHRYQVDLTTPEGLIQSTCLDSVLFVSSESTHEKVQNLHHFMFGTSHDDPTLKFIFSYLKHLMDSYELLKPLKTAVAKGMREEFEKRFWD